MTTTLHRLPAWISLTLFSLVALLSVNEEREQGEWEFEQKWCTALTSISFGLGVLTLIALTVPDWREQFVATNVEGGVIAVLIVVWILAVPVIMTPNHGLAVIDSVVVDANLYFASWCAFMSVLYMFASFGGETRTEMTKSLPTYARWWICLCISSIITAIAAVRSFHEINNCDVVKELCKEFRLGISLSVLSAVLAGVLVILSVSATHNKKLTPPVLTGAAIVALIVWATLVGKLTFKNGPASRVGTLFFGVWISLLLSLYLAVQHAAALACDAPTTTSKDSKDEETSGEEKHWSEEPDEEQAK